MAEVDPTPDEFKPVETHAMRHIPTDALIRVSGNSMTAEMSKLASETPDGRNYVPDKVIAMALGILKR